MAYKAQDYLESIAERLDYLDKASRNPDALNKFIDDELYSRLGRANYNFRKEPFDQVSEISTKTSKKVYNTKKPAKKFAKKPIK
ncbi:4780_t:CDS:1, partial [Acaulospora morrowiae]